jgi:hypothetical protein
MVVEPLTNFFVGRARADLRAGQSSVGGMLTAVNRDLETDDLTRRHCARRRVRGRRGLPHQFAQPRLGA